MKWKKIFNVKGKQRIIGITLLIKDETDFSEKLPRETKKIIK